MKYAILSGILFLATYLLANGGFGAQPLQVVPPLIVAVGVAAGVGWLNRGRRAARRNKSDAAEFISDPLAAPVPPPRYAPHATPVSPPTSSKRSGGARKLF